MQEIINTARQMADGNHPGMIGTDARKEMDRMARLLGECQAAMQDFVGKVERGEARSKRSYAWFKELLK